MEESRQLLNFTRRMSVAKKPITNTNQISLALAMLMISEGKSGAAMRLVAQVGEELEIQRVSMGVCEAQQEFVAYHSKV